MSRVLLDERPQHFDMPMLMNMLHIVHVQSGMWENGLQAGSEGGGGGGGCKQQNQPGP